jgi:hypothetical protein
MTNKNTVGEFGTIYTQFKDKPKEAIKFLMKVHTGEAAQALYRKEIGHIDIVWGDNTFGLKHIIEKHVNEIAQLGFKVEDFIPVVVQYGTINESKEQRNKIFLEGNMFRVVILTKWNGKKKTLLLSAFDLRPIRKKRS